MCVAACAAMSGCSSETQTDTQNSIPEPAEAVTGEASAENTEAETDEAAETENTDGAVSEAATTSAASNELAISGGTAVVYFSATGNTADIAEKALWKHFIKYYYEAYDVALRNAQKRLLLGEN